MLATDETTVYTRPRRGRIVKFVVAGTVLAYLATFVGHLTFYWSFQKTLLAQGQEPGAHAMLWRTPDETRTCSASTWTVEQDGDVSFRVPGKVTRIDRHGEARRVVIGEHEFMVQSFPKGFFGSLLRKELHSFGQRVESLPSDAEILAELVERTPDEYRFSWGFQKRSEYAADILVRMLLFEPLAVKRAVFVRREGSAACSYLVKYENGNTRVLTAGPQGSLIVLFQSDAPVEWSREPGNWLR